MVNQQPLRVDVNLQNAVSSLMVDINHQPATVLVVF